MKHFILLICVFVSVSAEAYTIKKTYFPKSAIDKTEDYKINYIDSFNDAQQLLVNKELDINGHLLFTNTYHYLNNKIDYVSKVENLLNTDGSLASTQEFITWYIYENGVLKKTAVAKPNSTDSIFNYYDAIGQALNGRLKYTFDKQGRITSSVYKAKVKQKNSTNYTYNKIGKIATIKEIEGKKVIATTTFSYNTKGHLIKEYYSFKKAKDVHETTTIYIYENDVLKAEEYIADQEPKETIVYSYE
jgi:hypothetical protein